MAQTATYPQRNFVRPKQQQSQRSIPKKVFICSPYRPEGRTEQEKQENLEQNLEVARNACSHAVEQGCIPYAPHLYFPQFLNDEDPADREYGIRLGLHWLRECDELWAIGAKITEGMQREIAYANEHGIPVTQRIICGGEAGMDTEELFNIILSAFFGSTFAGLVLDNREGQSVKASRKKASLDLADKRGHYDCGYEEDDDYRSFEDEEEEHLREY